MTINKINLGLGVAGEGDRSSSINNSGTKLEDVISLIKSKNLEPVIEAELLRVAKSYPSMGLHRFKKSLNRQITSAKKRIKTN